MSKLPIISKMRKKEKEEEQQYPRPLKKPVKDCYCYPEIRKTLLRSTRTVHKPIASCVCCRSAFDLKCPQISSNDDFNDHIPVETPLSRETLRRVSKINYVPRSRFLHNVQSRLSILNHMENPAEPAKCPCGSATKEDRTPRKIGEFRDNFQISTSSRSPSKKTICSKRSTRQSLSKRTTESVKALNSVKCIKDDHKNFGKEDPNIQDIGDFRTCNCFNTHASSATSTTSGSLEQCVLNKRLFPRSIGTVHRKDLVVTMPPCATKQRKRIHYLSRYVVNQDKIAIKQRKCRNCPLTGHAIDLGAMKMKPPSDSLALKFQRKP